MKHTFTAITVAATISAIAFVTSPVTAQEVDPVEKVKTAISAVCKIEKVVLSKNARAACSGDVSKMPKYIKAGTRFSNRGTGAEFNALIRNVALFN